jgi:N6-L-threonylcarbamoyladenine synthase
MEASDTVEAPVFTVLGNALLSQADKHAAFGGVFPNLAKREHQHNLVPILSEALREASLLSPRSTPLPETTEHELSHILTREPELQTFMLEFLREHDAPSLDCIAVTHGPGLEPALWVGVNFAKALAHVWNLPIVPVNHMEGHIVASLIQESREHAEPHPSTYHLSPITFPAIALLVSGGHTELQLVKKIGEYALLGHTRDDAAGECFDKCARLMNLPYPGGPHISRLAAEARTHKLPPTFALPRPMIDSRDTDFSFSGLKTAVRRTLEKHGALSEDESRALAREVEDAIVDVLVKKTLAAAETHGASTIIVGGGVSANAHLHTRLTEAAAETGATVLFPPRDLSTDNAIMIAMAAYAHALQQEFADPAHLKAQGNLKLA